MAMCVFAAVIVCERSWNKHKVVCYVLCMLVSVTWNLSILQIRTVVSYLHSNLDMCCLLIVVLECNDV